MKNILLLFELFFTIVLSPTISSAQWIAANPTLSGIYVGNLAVIGRNLYAGIPSRGVYLSTNDGASWTPLNSGLTNIYVNALSVYGTNLYAGTDGGGVFILTNTDTSWIATSVGPRNTHSLLVTSNGVGGTNLFAGTYRGGVFLSTDNGISWTTVNAGLTYASPSMSDVTTIQVLFAHGTDLFAGTNGYGDLYLSTNNGTNWTSVNAGLEGSNVYALASSGTDLFAGTMNRGVCLSTDNGTIWTAVDTGLRLVTSLAVVGKCLFAGTYTGVFLSTNNGTNWTDVSTGLTNTSIQTLIVFDSYLFAGGNGGMWRRPLSEMITTGVEHYPNPIPVHLALLQNFPNPFNSTTTIPFSLASKSYVSLKVFDLLGREVATIVSEDLGPGNYSRRWNANNNSSGAYFCRLQIESFIETRLLLLLK
jgi:hypothetical protein